jgi:hypothetical protein
MTRQHINRSYVFAQADLIGSNTLLYRFGKKLLKIRRPSLPVHDFKVQDIGISSSWSQQETIYAAFAPLEQAHKTPYTARLWKKIEHNYSSCSSAWICKCSNEYCRCPSHSHLPAWLPHSIE